jgi:D-alanyl-lipoteichoic acid acyltransferase DltB (MBOAT superfamily)
VLFNSPAFGIFLIAALFLFWSAPHRTRVFFIIGLSYYFYMYYYPPYAFLLALLTLFNYAIAIAMAQRPHHARWFLVVALAIDLSSIGFYKYAHFLAEILETLLAGYGVRAFFNLPDIMLPLGISFFTFQMISYIIDTYRGEPPEKSFWNFAAYISFFPQLVAGPIVRPKTLLPQIHTERHYNDEQALRGMFLIGQGLVKKIAFADFLGGYVDTVFAQPSGYLGLGTLIAVYAYAFQIYFDFSGYTDIAIGCGKLFGFEIPINFDLPYISKSPREFWHRWHISLSTWLRDYLYIPIGGNHKTEMRTHVNMMITMLLGGLWHGANWTFVLWGAFHGVLISLQRFLEERWAFFRRLTEKPSPVVSVVSTLLTFHLVCLGWVLFRAQNVTQAAVVIGNIFAMGAGRKSIDMTVVVLLAIAMLSHLFRSKVNLAEWYVRMPAPVQALGYSCMTIVLFLFFTTEQRFIYFQF